ncbi:UDP-glucose 4-epimerase GalE [Candidatus Roizmanbacteria bacterium RIFCSPHIGHO2_12_FULL_33_9]|uniref:UDP-glucose 4-epimerase n=1 Tax=Candidatus Roizmanbacteria bacterium RIFCSPHIGHO2_12_FULL_33_9 TaxID=1802045 RepID=A0A1F7HH91_9BACT|nr:MAG: UDP-glucose 4-epimerase GalE [Candidatus Roizmanbacteria bacterium RIFCSPHIGHO2_12_FULL_33_9]
MKILVTGGAGYIGSFMVRRLLEKKYDITVLDNLERGNQQAVDNRAVFVKGDILDDRFIKSLFKDDSFDCILHFAGYISMEESIKDPGLYFRNNTYGALNLIESSVKNGVKKFIFSSTAGVYGNPIKTPIPEDHPTNPTNPYGESKLMVEKILLWYSKIFGLNFVSLRYFNAAGASLDGSVGENHIPESHIIPLAIRAALQNSEFNLYGDDYKTPDGTCIRDYIHVIDLVGAHILALEKLQNDKGQYFYNVGTGEGYSNKEVLEMIKKISKKDLKIKITKRRPGDAEILIADPTKIGKELGFSPKYSDLETIVKTAWEWHKNNLKFKI